LEGASFEEVKAELERLTGQTMLAG
jgi:hypothetical protein